MSCVEKVTTDEMMSKFILIKVLHIHKKSIQDLNLLSGIANQIEMS